MPLFLRGVALLATGVCLGLAFFWLTAMSSPAADASESIRAYTCPKNISYLANRSDASRLFSDDRLIACLLDETDQLISEMSTEDATTLNRVLHESSPLWHITRPRVCMTFKMTNGKRWLSPHCTIEHALARYRFVEKVHSTNRRPALFQPPAQ
jgi:hypothetical protein